MKTKTMAVSLVLTFFSCSLFAQNQTDTVPTPTTDSVPKTDTATTDTSKVNAFVTEPVKLNKVSQDNTAFLEVVSTSSAKEEETVSAK